MRFLLAVLACLFVSAALCGAILGATVWSGTVELPGGQKLDFTVELERDSGTISIPLQGAKDLPLSDVSVTEKELRFAIRAAGAAWEMHVSDDGRTATGVLRQGGEFKTTMRRHAPDEPAVKELVRPQEPKPPFPYETLEVTVENTAAKVKLAGTLVLPAREGRFPCVVLVTGSGPQDRDETLLGHKPFLVLADHLARHGIASLRYDDRGTAKSTGSFAKATSDDFASDALAAVQFLKARAEILPDRIGVVGHSEGGVVAPMCAAQSRDVAFIVLLAGTGLPGAELLPLQGKLISLAGGASVADAEKGAKLNAEIYQLVLAGKSRSELADHLRKVLLEELRADPEQKDLPAEELAKQADQAAEAQARELTSPWFRRFLALDPRDHLAKVACPVLALNGEKDLQVPPKENLSRIDATLKAAGNPDVTVVELPSLNHLFQTCTTGSPSEYGALEETFSPVALELVSTWIRKHTTTVR